MKTAPQTAHSESQQSHDVAQRRNAAHGMLDNRPQSDRLRQLKEIAAGGLPLQRAFKDEDEHLTDATHNKHPASLKATGSNDASVTAQRQARSDGLPSQLKTGIESMSGMSMDHVKVHYNSSQPAQLNAHAFAQGSDIHVAPGQERHLPHEAWHVVQQAQGRVQPTTQMKAEVPVNDDHGLEHEADVMGAQAMSVGQAAQR